MPWIRLETDKKLGTCQDGNISSKLNPKMYYLLPMAKKALENQHVIKIARLAKLILHLLFSLSQIFDGNRKPFFPPCSSAI